MRTMHAWAGIGFVAAALGCGDVDPDAGGPETSGYLLLGSTARHAGVELADGTAVGALPVALPIETPALVLRTAVVELPGAADVLTYAFAADITRRIKVEPVRRLLENHMAAKHDLPQDLRITDLGRHDEKHR